MQKPSIVDILYRYQQQESLTEEDRRILEDWLQASEANQDLFNDISNKEEWNRKLEVLKSRDSRPGWNRILERIEAGTEKPVLRPIPWKKYATVVAIFGGAVAGTYLLVARNDGVMQVREQTQEERFKNDVIAASPDATLTLADGTLVRLNRAGIGKLKEANSIWKTDSNSLSIRESNVGPEERFNTLTTPTGTRYQLTLADGSAVWLNAGSSLQFPTAFSGTERKVILSGEAYFEIAKDPEKPFMVEAASSTTRVLGTTWVLGAHFNVRSYPTESTTKTTVLEGVLRFREGTDSVAVRPGQQASLRQNGRITLDSVNTQAATAWRENLFWFQAESYESIMDELARWYPIHVKYQGKIADKFTGILPRGHSLVEVLKSLEVAGSVNFRINGAEVEVMPRATAKEGSP
jgi:ferric-dicitrate binding protein FerR (iron transport regulator)